MLRSPTLDQFFSTTSAHFPPGPSSSEHERSSPTSAMSIRGPDRSSVPQPCSFERKRSFSTTTVSTRAQPLVTTSTDLFRLDRVHSSAGTHFPSRPLISTLPVSFRAQTLIFRLARVHSSPIARPCLDRVLSTRSVNAHLSRRPCLFEPDRSCPYIDCVVSSANTRPRVDCANPSPTADHCVVLSANACFPPQPCPFEPDRSSPP